MLVTGYVLVMVLIGVCHIIPIVNAYGSLDDSSIVISRDLSSSRINIVIHAPDFNSNSYAIDTIGEDGGSITISTREASIPYKLVETGQDTGVFAGYVILSSNTSVCSPVCGPTDGFLAAGGDDAVTVSFTYANGHTISASSHGTKPIPDRSVIPEFSYVGFSLLSGIACLILIHKMNFIH